MRILIRSCVLIDGTGAPARDHVTVVVDDYRIESIGDDGAGYYDRADSIIDADGGFVIPGVLNHHAHGMTRGPLMILGQPALSDQRVRINCSRMLAQGVTRVCNVDGFAVTEEAVASSRFPGLTVKITSLHTSRHLEWALKGPFRFGGIGKRHRSTVEEQLSLGAVGIGEIGPGIDHHWVDFALLPEGMTRLTNSPVDWEQAQGLRLAAEHEDAEQLTRLLADVGVSNGQKDFLQLLATTREWRAMAEAACREALEIASRLHVPVVLHHTPTTYELALEAAEVLGPQLICAHSNFQVEDPGVAVEHARELRRRGALIDVMTGDAYGGRRLFKDPTVTHAMLAAGVVDLISTDYAGGFWDSMLLVVEEAARAGSVSLEAGVRMVTGRVAEALPLFAPARGTVEVGCVADLVITEPGRLAEVRSVLVSGIPIASEIRETAGVGVGVGS